MTSTPDPVATPPLVTQPVILVVDDAVDTLRMLGDALVSEGYVVLAARDAEEALERFEVAVPDGVLLDAVMPGMDGFAFCEHIKATPAWSHVPIVFMTGLSESDQILRGFACGGVDYVVKPLRIPEVMARLATHVRNARVTRLAQEAVDVAGMGTVVLDTQGRMAWRSPQATAWLALAFGADAAAGKRAGEWLGTALSNTETTRDLGRHGRLLARNMGQGNLGESMLLLTLTPDSAAAQRLRDIALTPRETEVLSWLAKGKTNRDIADILGMSHRTVNKHLEHVFEKLGVETRSAAAAIAGRLLPQD
ncbi:DNA-binding response regulator [Hydrogenophaga sp.]|uniref:response regulator transcription factor n=1 Tax=Hydrogenophaga sp. TaxID=1904254 RepID=UPI0025B8939B|nr:DNA-binding response regulator [Hydrogenophaga sp.]MBT9467169.1 response regulator [Hydrogenophaga sp.]